MVKCSWWIHWILPHLLNKGFCFLLFFFSILIILKLFLTCISTFCTFHHSAIRNCWHRINISQIWQQVNKHSINNRILWRFVSRIKLARYLDFSYHYNSRGNSTVASWGTSYRQWWCWARHCTKNKNTIPNSELIL